MRRTLATLLLLALAATPTLGDVVHLTDGRTLVGKIKRANAEQWAITTADHKTTLIPRESVASIDLTARPTTDPIGAARRLASLRRAVSHVDDPADAIAQYDRFLKAGADPATFALAQQDVVIWRDRADHRFVRLGERWVHPAAREQALADALTYADAARQLVKQGRFTDAAPILTTALAIDPANVSALYLQGLVRLQQNQLADARAAFEAVATALPDHGPTRVNLAFIAWQQGRYTDALAKYDEAMILSPANPAVLANVAAALMADLPTAVTRSALFARVAQRCQAQQKQLADRMTALGLHPFGAAWLSDDQLASAQKIQQQNQVNLDALSAAFERAQDKIRATDLAIAEVELQLRRSATTGAQPLPGPWLASYDGDDGPRLSTVSYDLQNDADQLRDRRATAVKQLDDLQRQATAIRSRMAGGTAPVQRPVGPEGTPVRVTP